LALVFYLSSFYLFYCCCLLLSQVHVCNRWATSHTLDILNALFNGYGFEAWENVWGLWNSIVPFDAELLRRAATVSEIE
jgi:hypothetical protein